MAAAKPAKRTWVGWMMGEAQPGKGKAGEEGEGEGQLTPEEVAQLQEMAAEQQDALQSGTSPPPPLSAGLRTPYHLVRFRAGLSLLCMRVVHFLSHPL